MRYRKLTQRVAQAFAVGALASGGIAVTTTHSSMAAAAPTTVSSSRPARPPDLPHRGRTINIAPQDIALRRNGYPLGPADRHRRDQLNRDERGT